MRRYALALFLLAGLALCLVAPTRPVEAQVPGPSVVRLSSFQLVVSAANTPVNLPATAASVSGGTITGNYPTFCRQVTIQPLNGNVSTSIEIQTSAGGAAGTGYQLLAGQQIVIPIQGNLTAIWIRVGTNGDGVSCIAWAN